MHQCSKGHQPLVSIILQATEKALGIQSHMKESLKTEQHVKALLRVILVACQASPASFAQGLVHIPVGNQFMCLSSKADI
jgi:hypothetical protein